MRDATLCFPVRADQVLLGRKKRGFGAGRWNGFGGKVGPNESIEAATRRELEEECGLTAHALTRVARLEFYFEERAEWDQVVHVYLTRSFSGQATESEEMAPDWFTTGDLPFDEMWEDDRHWLPLVLQGQRIEGRFRFDGRAESMLAMRVVPVDRLPETS